MAMLTFFFSKSTTRWTENNSTRRTDRNKLHDTKKAGLDIYWWCINLIMYIITFFAQGGGKSISFFIFSIPRQFWKCPKFSLCLSFFITLCYSERKRQGRILWCINKRETSIYIYKQIFPRFIFLGVCTMSRLDADKIFSIELAVRNVYIQCTHSCIFLALKYLYIPLRTRPRVCIISSVFSFIRAKKRVASWW